MAPVPSLPAVVELLGLVELPVVVVVPGLLEPPPVAVPGLVEVPVVVVPELPEPLVPGLVVAGDVEVVVVPPAEPDDAGAVIVEEPSPPVCAVCAGYGASGAPPLAEDVDPGVVVSVVVEEEGSTVGSDCVWVRPDGVWGVGGAGVVAVVVLVEPGAGVLPAVPASATVIALVICDPLFVLWPLLASGLVRLAGRSATVERGSVDGAATGTGEAAGATLLGAGAAALTGGAALLTGW